MVFRGKEITFNAIEFGLSNGDRKKTTSMFNNPNIAGTRTFRDNLQKYPLVNSKLRLIGLIVSLKILKGTKIKVLTKKIIIDIAKSSPNKILYIKNNVNGKEPLL